MNTAGWATSQVIAAYLVALLVFGALDALWLGWVAKDFYRRELGDLMADSPRMIPAALFYVAYPTALLYFGLGSLAPDGESSLWLAFMRCAAFGLAAYATYDLTSMSVIRNFPIRLGMVDIVWGSFLSGASGMAALAAVRWWMSRG